MTCDDVRPALVDTAYELLADPRRRYLLYALLDEDRHDIDELAREIVSTELDTAPSAVSDTDHRQAVVSLVHNHLPRLADHAILEYDSDEQTVARAERFEDFEPFVSRAEAREQDTRTVETPTGSRWGGLSD